MVHFKFKILLMMVCFMLISQVSASEEEFKEKVKEEWKNVTSVDYAKSQELITTKIGEIKNEESLKSAFDLIQKNMLTSVFQTHTKTMNEAEVFIKKLGHAGEKNEKSNEELQEEQQKFEENVLKFGEKSQGNEVISEKTKIALEKLLDSIKEEYTDEKLSKFYSEIQEIIFKSAYNVHATNKEMEDMQKIIDQYEEYAKDFKDKISPKQTYYNPEDQGFAWTGRYKNGGTKIKDAILSLAWNKYKETERYKEIEKIAKILNCDAKFDESNKKVFDENFKAQWPKVQIATDEINFQISNLQIQKNNDGYYKELQKVEDIAIKSAYKVQKEERRNLEENKEKISSILNKSIDKNDNSEETEEPEKSKGLEEEIKVLKEKLQAEKLKGIDAKEFIPRKDIQTLIENIQTSKKGRSEIKYTGSKDEKISETVKKINELLKSYSEGNKTAADLIAKLAASIESKETVVLDESTMSKEDKEDAEKIIKVIKNFEEYKNAINSLKGIAEGKNVENNQVLLEGAKTIATEVENLRSSQKCYKTATIILSVIIAVGGSTYLFMQYKSDEPEEKSEDQSDEQSYDTVDKKTAKKTETAIDGKATEEADKKATKEADKKATKEAVEKATNESDEKAAESINGEENQEVPAQVSKEIQDTKNLATNETEQGHVLIDVKE